MRIRTISLLSVFALVIVACGAAAQDTTTTSSSTPETTTTTTLEVETPEGVLLAYTLEPGTSFTYEVGIDQDIDMTTTGDTSALSSDLATPGEAEGGEEEIPGEMSLNITGTTVFTHSIAAGPEPGTFEVRITGDFTDLEFSGTVDGEPVAGDEIPDLAEMEPIDVTVIVDEQGNVIPGDESGGLFGELGGLDMLDSLGGSAGMDQFIGPPFTEEEVTVGDTWSETVEIPAMPGEDPITTQIESEVVATDSIEGNEVFVIETTTTTSPIQFDLAELLLGFMFAFVPDDATEEEVAEMEALADQIRFVFSMDETTAEMTTWFDHQAGYARQADHSSTVHLVMDINMPDDETGELTAFGLDMNLSQDITYRLTEAGTA